MEYQTGDHLGVLPRNNVDLIRRVMARFGLDACARLSPSTRRAVARTPTCHWEMARHYLGSSAPASSCRTSPAAVILLCWPGTLRTQQRRSSCGPCRASTRRAGRPIASGWQPLGGSVLELLDEFPSCNLPFNVYLEPLPPIRPRYYSISSSPAVASTCHLTVGVLHGPACSGDGYFNGVASNHLGSSMEGSTQFTFVRKPTIPFRPPANPHVPMIMVGAATEWHPSAASCKSGPPLRRRASLWEFAPLLRLPERGERLPLRR